VAFAVVCHDAAASTEAKHCGARAATQRKVWNYSPRRELLESAALRFRKRRLRCAESCLFGTDRRADRRTGRWLHYQVCPMINFIILTSTDISMSSLILAPRLIGLAYTKTRHREGSDQHTG
jgi:hypothetical protein